jgi:hypothetical protein
MGDEGCVAAIANKQDVCKPAVTLAAIYFRTNLSGCGRILPATRVVTSNTTAHQHF